MRIWDAELLTASGRLKPVTDGLLLWLDGRDALTGETELCSETPPIYSKASMTDRAAGIAVAFAQKSGSGLGVRSDVPFIRWSNPEDAAGEQTVTPQISISNVLTVEYVVYNPITVSLPVAKPNANYLYYPTISNYDSARIAPKKVVTNAVVHILCTPDADGLPVIYQNGEVTSTRPSGAKTVQAVTATQILSANRWATKLGCVRFYSRALTDAEVQQNYNYEISIGRITT